MIGKWHIMGHALRTRQMIITFLDAFALRWYPSPVNDRIH